jgi:hypothetical protein
MASSTVEHSSVRKQSPHDTVTWIALLRSLCKYVIIITDISPHMYLMTEMKVSTLLQNSARVQTIFLQR